jgi:hypothetical protein
MGLRLSVMARSWRGRCWAVEEMLKVRGCLKKVSSYGEHDDQAEDAAWVKRLWSTGFLGADWSESGCCGVGVYFSGSGGLGGGSRSSCDGGLILEEDVGWVVSGWVSGSGIGVAGRE